MTGKKSRSTEREARAIKKELSFRRRTESRLVPAEAGIQVIPFPRCHSSESWNPDSAFFSKMYNTKYRPRHLPPQV